MDARRTRFTDAAEIRRRLGQGWPEVFDDQALEAMRAEVDGLAWGLAEDATIALASEYAGVGARRIGRIIDPNAKLNVVHQAIRRGRLRLEELRRARRWAAIPPPASRG